MVNIQKFLGSYHTICFNDSQETVDTDSMLLESIFKSILISELQPVQVLQIVMNIL